jgi:hypothetical protein
MDERVQGTEYRFEMKYANEIMNIEQACLPQAGNIEFRSQI